MQNSVFCDLRSDLATSIRNRGASAAAAANRVMPFARPSRKMAQNEGVQIRISAVLFAIFPKNGVWCGLLMKRTKFPGVHSGQISIPGGEREKDDTSLMETARREFQEEVGVVVSPESIIGPLSERFIPSSRFAVTPYLAVLAERPNWNIDPREVESLIEFSIESISSQSGLRPVDMEVFPGIRHSIPVYPILGHNVWGATALILTEFLEHWNYLKEAHRNMH